MASRVHALFTRPTPSARRAPVVATRLPAAPVQTPVQAPAHLPGIGAATRDRCACGAVYGTDPGVWQELRGRHLRACCAGCCGPGEGGR